MADISAWVILVAKTTLWASVATVGGERGRTSQLTLAARVERLSFLGMAYNKLTADG